jgi:lipopolysaccharide/colanic/teichoic acid biosynthesis glycosyltransferase
MSANQLEMNLLRHFQAAQNPFGRFLLNLHFQLRRTEWFLRNYANPVAKRALDIVVSAVLLGLLTPLFTLIALLVKLEDGGPVFFAQKRVGRNGREFKMFKIRSMCMDAEQKLKDLLAKNQHRDGVTFKIKDDPRITKVGKWLRKLSLDELPQLVNVLRGEMSLVGPRPPVPREVENTR